MSENKLQATTLPLFEEGSTYAFAEENTTYADGEESPSVSLSAEKTTVFQANAGARHGGPFGAY